MKENYEQALRAVLVHEGGKVDDPKDPGGRTAYGVTQKVYTAWRKRKGLGARDVFQITPDEIVAIYKAQYWDAVKADLMPDGLDYCVFDAAVNSGPDRAIRWLQRCLGLVVDGQIGQITLDAIESHPDIDKLIADFCQRRLLFCRALKTWKHYGKGWTTRIAGVQRIAQAQASGTTGPTPIYAAFGDRNALVKDAKHAPQTILADASAGGGFSVTGFAGWIKEQTSELMGASDFTDRVLTSVMAIAVFVTIVAGLYALYARKRAAVLADRLDTKPAQLVSPMAAPTAAEESDVIAT